MRERIGDWLVALAERLVSEIIIDQGHYDDAKWRKAFAFQAVGFAVKDGRDPRPALYAWR